MSVRRDVSHTVSLRRAATDPSAFEAFYRAHAQTLLVFFVRRTLDPHLALELSAETFASAYIKRRQFRGATEDEAASWLFRIAHNQLAHYHRRGEVARRATERLALTEPTFSEGDLERIEELAGLSELRAQVATDFAALPPIQRDALVLRVIEELPYPDVALRLGISEQTARARVSRGLRALRGGLSQQGLA